LNCIFPGWPRGEEREREREASQAAEGFRVPSGMFRWKVSRLICENEKLISVIKVLDEKWVLLSLWNGWRERETSQGAVGFRVSSIEVFGWKVNLVSFVERKSWIGC
jgi:hypothetical protein